MADRTVSVRLKADVASYMAKMRAAGKATEEVAEDTSRSFGKASRDIDKIAKRTQFQYKALATAIAAASPVAAATAMGVAATAAGAAFVGLGAVALRNNAAVRNSFIELGRTVSSDLTADAAVMEDEFVGAAQKMGAAYQGLRPQIRGAFADSAPYVDTLTEGVTDLAENAIPGVTRSVSEAGPAVKGFATLLADTGTGLGGFFDEVAEHSDAAGQGLEHLGDLMAGTLPSLGGVLGNLTDLWAEHGDTAVDVINQLMSIIDKLTAGALPAFGTSLGVALNILSALLDVIEPIAGVLGTGIGVWLAYAAAIRMVTATQGAIGGLSNKVRGLKDSWSGMSNTTAAAGVALAGVGFAAQMALGRVGEFDTQAAEMVKGLESFAETGKASGEAARLFGEDLSGLGEAMSLVTEGGFVGWTREFGEGLANAFGAQGELGDAREQVAQLDEALASMVESGNSEGAFGLLQKSAQAAGVSIDELKAQLPGYREALDAANREQAELGTTAMQSRPGIAELEEAITTLGTKTASTADKVDALNTAWRELFGVQLTLKEAVSAFEEGLDNIAAAYEEAQAAGGDWEAQLFNANGTVNLATEAGRQLNAELTAEGDNYRALAQTAYDTAIKQGQSQEMATQAARDAVQRRREQFIQEQRALGRTREHAEQLADEYFGMPRDVITHIRNPGMLTAIAEARRLAGWYNSIPRHVQTVIQAVAIGPVGAALAGASVLSRYGAATGGKVTASGIERYAGGGRIKGPGTGTSDSILAFAEGGPLRVSNGEFISTAASTRRNEEALYAGNRGATLVAIGPSVEGLASGGMVQAEDGSWVPKSFYSKGPIKPVEAGRVVKQTPRTATAGAGGTTLVFNFPNYVGNRAELMAGIRREVNTKFGGNVQMAFTGRRS